MPDATSPPGCARRRTLESRADLGPPLSRPIPFAPSLLLRPPMAPFTPPAKPSLNHPPTEPAPAGALYERAATWPEPPMFFFFSNRAGCLGSIAISVVLTLVLLAVFGLL